MKDRILQFLKAENKSSAQFAEEIGVQPSGISHILSGRNNPSLDFVLKMMEKYQFLSVDWLLFGKGTMYKEIKLQSLFDETNISDRNTGESSVNNEPQIRQTEDKSFEKKLENMETHVKNEKNQPAISRIVMFYYDNSFEEYFPRS